MAAHGLTMLEWMDAKDTAAEIWEHYYPDKQVQQLAVNCQLLLQLL